MPTFRVSISRPLRIQAPVINRAQRLAVGNVVIDVVRERIKRAIDANDAPARPLSAIRPKHGGASYAVQKQEKTGKRPVRDWTLTGALLRSLRVSVATEKRIVISPAADQMGKMAGNQGLCNMFAISPKDEAVINQTINALYAQMAQRMVIAAEALRSAGMALITSNALTSDLTTGAAYTGSTGRAGGEFL